MAPLTGAIRNRADPYRVRPPVPEMGPVRLSPPAVTLTMRLPELMAMGAEMTSVPPVVLLSWGLIPAQKLPEGETPKFRVLAPEMVKTFPPFMSPRFKIPTVTDPLLSEMFGLTVMSLVM